MSLNRLEKLLVTFTILSCWGIVAIAVLFLQQPQMRPPLPTPLENHVELADDLPLDEMPGDDGGTPLPAEEPAAGTQADSILDRTSDFVAWLEAAAATTTGSASWRLASSQPCPKFHGTSTSA